MFDETAPPAQMQRVDWPRRGRDRAGRAAEGFAPARRGQGDAAADGMAARRRFVFLNTAGGLTAGDRLVYGLEVAGGAAAVGTTQTAERAYLSRGGAAQVENTVAHRAGRAAATGCRRR